MQRPRRGAPAEEAEEDLRTVVGADDADPEAEDEQADVGVEDAGFENHGGLPEFVDNTAKVRGGIRG